MTALRREALPRRRVERTTAISSAVTSLPEVTAIAVVAYLLYRCPLPVIARELGMPMARAKVVVWAGISGLYHPARSAGMRPFHGDEDQTVTIDLGLRSFIRRHRIEERFQQRCSQCSEEMQLGAPLFEPGRPRQYCSNRCRQKAYRLRRSAAEE
ncbi:hypothetical protein [Streptomyces sp. NPDC085665]|uniref:hypothetical protein n=1 Tax=Streptomyces sp. NPDC085665 TaxID=3365735 RepID=UPI0037D6B2CC